MIQLEFEEEVCNDCNCCFKYSEALMKAGNEHLTKKKVREAIKKIDEWIKEYGHTEPHLKDYWIHKEDVKGALLKELGIEE